MTLYRVVDKITGLFIRDDFEFDDSLEVGINCEPAQGLYMPKYDFEKLVWCESASQEYIDSLKQPIQEVQPIEERLTNIEQEQEVIISVLTDIMGV